MKYRLDHINRERQIDTLIYNSRRGRDRVVLPLATASKWTTRHLVVSIPTKELPRRR